jgi:hypothetical protein
LALGDIPGELDNKQDDGPVAREENCRHLHGRPEAAQHIQEEADSMGMASIPPVGGTGAEWREPLRWVHRLPDPMLLAMRPRH